jgi:hypothetical protein
MQWSAKTEVKVRWSPLAAVLRLYISVALQQKAGNFKVAIESRQMQWRALSEEKQKNQLAQTEFRFVKK